MSAKIERRTISDARLETRAAGEDQPMPQIVGYAAVFNVETTLYSSPTLVVKETIKPGAFANAISQGDDCRALIDHDSSLLIGRVRSGTCVLKEDDHGLSVTINPPNTSVARDLIENIRVGNVSGMSFAFLPRSGGETVATTIVDGVTVQSIEITDVTLYDVSVCTYPQYPETSASLRAKQMQAELKTQWLAERHAKISRLNALSVK